MKNNRHQQEIDTQNRVSQNYDGDRYKRPHSRLYHTWWAVDMVVDTPDEGLWLDLGCGTGWMQEVLSSKNYRRRIVGIDISEGMLRFARQKHIPVVLGDAKKIPFRDSCFDGVIAKGVLHHLPAIAAAVSEIARILKPGGLVVLADPNLSPLRTLKYTLNNTDEHFSPLHRSIRPMDFIKAIEQFLEVVDFGYFGFLAYPAAFPDVLPLSISSKIMADLIKIDRIISRIPFLNRLCWAFKLTARKSIVGL